MKITLVRKGSPNKSGGTRFGLEGVRASAYFPPSMFVGDAPASIEVEVSGEQAQGPDGPLTDAEGVAVMKQNVFATETTQRQRGGTTSGVRVNAELQKAREEAKRLREESKKVLKDAREKIKSSRKSGKNADQPSLVDEGAVV
jgi:hypothetical protein